VTNGSASTGWKARNGKCSKVTMDLCTVLSSVQMESYMLVEAVRTNVIILLVIHVRLMTSCLSSRHCLSEDGMLSLIACFVRAHPCLLRHHPIVADHTREGIRALARSLQRKLEIFIHIGVDRLVSQHIAFIFVPEVYMIVIRLLISHQPLRDGTAHSRSPSHRRVRFESFDIL